MVNIKDLARFEPNTTVDVETLKEAGIVKKVRDGVKLLAEGELSHPLVVRVHKASLAARQKVEAAGGRVELL